MTDQSKPATPGGHGSYERRDIGAAGVLYFLAALAIGGVIVHFIATGVFHELERRNDEAQQTAISPLVTNAPTDTRHLPPVYKSDAESTDYEKYLQKNFPAPRLETDERDQLDRIRTNEEEILNTYGYVDQSAGTVHIPIERAMDLLAQRGLPVREQSSAAESKMKESKTTESKTRESKTKGSKK